MAKAKQTKLTKALLETAGDMERLGILSKPGAREDHEASPRFGSSGCYDALAARDKGAFERIPT